MLSFFPHISHIVLKPSKPGLAQITVGVAEQSEVISGGKKDSILVIIVILAKQPNGPFSIYSSYQILNAANETAAAAQYKCVRGGEGEKLKWHGEGIA